jgi:flagellar protein FliS
MITARDTYMSNMASTASPARLLVMLYDRLMLDLERAIEAQDRADHSAASPHLLHAQEIVLELQSSLRLDAWDGAARLSGIYSWLHSEMVRANVKRDVAATRGCLELVVPLADAWREAALTAVAS